MSSDEWRTESPEDEYARHNPQSRNGVYTVAVTRQIEATLWVEVEATSHDEARAQAIEDSKAIPFTHWVLAQDDYDTGAVVGPPEFDPDTARENRYDR